MPPQSEPCIHTAASTLWTCRELQPGCPFRDNTPSTVILARVPLGGVVCRTAISDSEPQLWVCAWRKVSYHVIYISAQRHSQRLEKATRVECHLFFVLFILSLLAWHTSVKMNENFCAKASKFTKNPPRVLLLQTCSFQLLLRHSFCRHKLHHYQFFFFEVPSITVS